MTALRVEAVVTWVYAAGFGIATIPVALYLARYSRLPVFLGLFESFGGPWSSRFGHGTFTWLLLAFLAVTVAAGWAAWLVWHGSKVGAALTLALLPVEAVFWFGFALPIPVLLGLVRVVLLVVGWRALEGQI
jgi:hypothetical protein